MRTAFEGPWQARESSRAKTIFLLKKKLFTAEEAAKLSRLAEAHHRVHIPGRTSEAPYGELFAGTMTPEQYHAWSRRLIDPVFDDPPFYFAWERPNGLPWALKQFLGYLRLRWPRSPR